MIFFFNPFPWSASAPPPPQSRSYAPVILVVVIVVVVVVETFTYLVYLFQMPKLYIFVSLCGGEAHTTFLQDKSFPFYFMCRILLWLKKKNIYIYIGYY